MACFSPSPLLIAEVSTSGGSGIEIRQKQSGSGVYFVNNFLCSGHILPLRLI
jgi:hypothetical protein